MQMCAVVFSCDQMQQTWSRRLRREPRLFEVSLLQWPAFTVQASPEAWLSCPMKTIDGIRREFSHHAFDGER
jgi:hypothetical protein